MSGLVYRQIVELRAGVRDMAATRDLIVRENMRYARRQLVWFRGEPAVHWIDAPGESEAARAGAVRTVRDWIDRTAAGASGSVEAWRSQ
ncbi:tRNA delta(2)-isopentenylpyrophosphate transferase [compost metagenome]